MCVSSSSPRAAAFYALTAKQLASWFQRIGLEMYSDIVEHSISSGERLATMISSPTNDELVVSHMIRLSSHMMFTPPPPPPHT